MTAELKHSDGTPVRLKLYISDDIEFQTPQQFDPPSEADLQRAKLAALEVEAWADKHDRQMAAKRTEWANEVWHREGPYDC